MCAAYIVRVNVHCCAYIYTTKTSRGGELTGINGQKEIAVCRCKGTASSACACSPRIRDFQTRDTFPDVLAQGFRRTYTQIPL